MSALWLIALALGAPPAPPSPDAVIGRTTVESTRLADGSTLVLARTPGATTAALRYFVRTGATADPLLQSGLAHVVEHLVFRGHEGRRQHALFAAARARGVRINGHTTMDRTVFELDGPLDGMRALLPEYLDVITAPALAKRDLDIERAVVSAENELSSGSGLDSLAIILLAPAFRDRATVIGTAATRQQVRAEDARTFVAEHYRPRNVTIILTGDMTLADARALVEGSSRLAPHPDAAPRPEAADLQTPVDTSLRAPFFLDVTGYELAEDEAPQCEGLAELVTLRLHARLDETIESVVDCIDLRGHRLLIVATQTETQPDGDLVDRVAGAFGSVREQPMTPSEKAFIARRSDRRRARLAAQPVALADALVERATRSPDDLTAVLAAPQLDGGRLRAAARAAFVDSRRVHMSVRPY